MSGKWKNELGSVMELMEHKNGQITGMYLTAVTTSKKSDHTEETADLVGYINTDQTNRPLLLLLHGLEDTRWVLPRVVQTWSRRATILQNLAPTCLTTSPGSF